MLQHELGRVVAKNFRIVKKLGEGAFGEIFLGVNTKNESEVAIKI
jgi:serine/threonine protein kinase